MYDLSLPELTPNASKRARVTWPQEPNVGRRPENAIETATISLTEYREQVRKDLLGQAQNYGHIKKQVLPSLLAPQSTDGASRSRKYSELHGNWDTALTEALEQPETAIRFSKAIKPFALTDYKAEMSEVMKAETPELDPGSQADEVCHPVLKRLELFKRTVHDYLQKEPGQFKLVNCVMEEYEGAIRIFKSMLKKKTVPTTIKEALFHVTQEYRESLEHHDHLKLRLHCAEAENMDLKHMNSQLKQALDAQEARLDCLQRSVQDWAHKIFPDNSFSPARSWGCAAGPVGDCKQAAECSHACQCFAPRGFLDEIMGHVQELVKSCTEQCERSAADVQVSMRECEEAKRQAEHVQRANKWLERELDERDMRVCEVKGTVQSLMTRLAKIQTLRDQVQSCLNHTSLLEHKIGLLQAQEGTAMGLMVHYLARRGYVSDQQKPPERRAAIEAAGMAEDVPTHLRGCGQLHNRMLSREETNRILDGIWKDKRRWEAKKRHKVEFGPHYVNMLQTKFGVVGNTAGVGSLQVLEHIYSLIDSCSTLGQRDVDYFMYSRLLKSEIPDEMFAEIQSQVTLFEQTLTKKNQNVPRVPLKVPKKPKVQWEYVPVHVIHDVIEELCSAKSDARLDQLRFAVTLFANDGDVSENKDGTVTEWIRMHDLFDKEGKFMETFKLQQLEEYDELVEEIRHCVLAQYPTLAANDTVSLVDIFHAFVRTDPRQPKKTIKRALMVAAGLPPPTDTGGTVGYCDIEALDMSVEFTKFFAAFRRLCHVAKCTKS